MLPGQREAHLGERRDVTGADGAELVDDRVRTPLQRLAQRGDHGGPQSGACGQHLVGADGEHRADLPGGEFPAHGAGVAAQQAQTVPGGGLGGHVLVPVRTHTGGAAVHAPGRRDLPGGVPGLLRPPHRLGRGDRPRGPVGEAHDVLDSEGSPVQDHCRGPYGFGRVHDARRHQAHTPLARTDSLFRHRELCMTSYSRARGVSCAAQHGLQALPVAVTVLPKPPLKRWYRRGDDLTTNHPSVVKRPPRVTDRVLTVKGRYWHDTEEASWPPTAGPS